MDRRRHWVWVLWGLVTILLLAGCAKGQSLASTAESAPSPGASVEMARSDGSGNGYAFDDSLPRTDPVVSQTASPAPSPDRKRKGSVHPAPTPTQAPTAPEDPSSGGEAPSDTAEGPRDRPLLIYTAQVHLAVFETKKTLAVAEKLLKESRGYLVEQSDRSITFRVPAEKFEEVLEEVLELGDVVHQDVKARDVTDEFLDLETRLYTLEAIRSRLEELLRRAENVEEALAVEKELGRVVGEIEQLKGRLKLLRELIAYSTITVHLRPRSVENLDPTFHLPFPWLQTLGLGELLSL